MAKSNTADTGSAFANMGELPFFGFTYDTVLDGQSRNLAALMEANKVWAESARALVARHMEIARQSIQDLAELVQESIRKPGAFEEQIGKSAAYTRRALESVCDLTDQATKSNAEVMKVLNKRMTETFEEPRSAAKRPAASGAAAAVE